MITILLSFAHISYGQNSFFTGISAQSVYSNGVSNGDFEPVGFEFGYLSGNRKVLGIYGSLNFDFWRLTTNNLLKTITSASPYMDNRQVDVTNRSFSAGIGPAFKLQSGENSRLRFNVTYNLSHIETSSIYTDERTYGTYAGGYQYTLGKTESLATDADKAQQVISYFRVKMGYDLFKTFPAGVEIGWQNLDFGKTMNRLNPDTRFSSSQFHTRSHMYFAGLMIFF